LEKADRIAHNYVDKACKADTYEKKIQNFNSKSTKLKDIADKRLLQENEELNGKITQATFSKSELDRARKEYKNIQQELSKSCESFETQRLAYLERINELESELELESDKFEAFKEEKNSEFTQIQKNILLLKNQNEDLESELSKAKQKQSEVLQKIEAEKSLKFNLKQENHTLQDEIRKLKSVVQELSSQKELSDKKLIEMKEQNEAWRLESVQEKTAHSKLAESLKKDKGELEKELRELRMQISQNEVNFNSLLEKERSICVGLSQKTKDQSETISAIQNKLTACISDLEHERAEYKVNASILKSSHEKSEKEFKIQIGQLKDQINDINDKSIRKEEYYQSLLEEEKQMNGGLSVKVRDQASRICSMEEKLDMITAQNKKEVEELNDELNSLESKHRLSLNQLSEATLKIEKLESELSAHESTHSDETANMLSQISDLEFLKGKLNVQVQESQNLIQEQNTMIQKLEDTLNEKTVNVQSLSQQCLTMEGEMKDLMKKFTTVKVAFEEEKNLHEQTKQISENRISELEKEINEVYQNSTDKDKLLQSLLESEIEKSRSLRSQNSDLESKIVSLEDDVKSKAKIHGEHVQSMQMELDEMNSKNYELSNDVAILRTDISALKSENQSILEEYKSMEASLKSNVNSLEEKNQELLAELSKSLNVNDEKTQVIEMLEKYNMEKGASISNLEDELCRSKEEIKSYLEKFERFEMELQKSTGNLQETTDAYEKKLCCLQTEASDLNREKVELLSRTSDLEAELLELQNNMNEKDIATRCMEDKITELDKTRLSAIKQIDDLGKILKDKDVKIGTLEVQIQQSTHNIQILEDNIKANSQALSETQENLMASISQLNIQLQERQDEIKFLQDSLVLSQKERDDSHTLCLEFENSAQAQSALVLEMEGKLQDAAKMIADLQNDAENNLTIIKRSEDKISELIDQNQKLNQENETRAQNEKNLKDEVDSSKKLFSESESKMQSQIDDYQVELEELRESLVRDREEYKLERKYFNDQMTALIGQLNKEIVLKENEIALCKDLSDKLDTVKKEKNELESKVKENSLKNAEEGLAKLENLQLQVEKLSSTLDFKSGLLKDLESQLEDSQSRLSVAELRLLNELSSKEMHFKSFEDRLKSKCSEVENLTKSHLEMKKNLAKVKEENKNLSSECEKSKAAIARYKEVERLVLLEKKNLENGHKDSVSQVDKYKKEIAKYLL
jgi:myosin protein heavy chain